MKKCALFLILSLLLTGCGGMQQLETLGQISCMEEDLPPQRRILLQLPEDAALSTLCQGADQLYECNGYMVLVQILPGGNVAGSIQTVCGMAAEQLTVLQSRCGDHARLDWVWTAAGEGGDVMCRAAILDDGLYHYSLQVLAPAEQAGEFSDDWNRLFQSFCLE